MGFSGEIFPPIQDSLRRSSHQAKAGETLGGDWVTVL